MTKAKIKRPGSVKIRRRCVDLWNEIIKCRYGYESEKSGIPGYHRDHCPEGHQLHPHHIFGKATYELKFSLDNGIALTAYEHKWGAHAEDNREWWTWIRRFIDMRMNLPPGDGERYFDELKKKESKPIDHYYWYLREIYQALESAGKIRNKVNKLTGME